MDSTNVATENICELDPGVAFGDPRTLCVVEDDALVRLKIDFAHQIFVADRSSRRSLLGKN
jgi:hypothetical protein